MSRERAAHTTTASDPGGAPPGGVRVTQLTVERLGRRTLDDVCLDAPAGYTCVLGHSGSGKSTLLSAIAGTLKPSGGRIEIGNEVVTDADAGVFLPPERRRLGMVFQ